LHVPLVHGVPVVQHGSPESPHDSHVVSVPVTTHTVLGSVHALPGQHSSPSLPHDSQKPPAVHTSSMPAWPQEAPTATQVLDWVSQQPPVHWSPRQHACPVPPQAAHVVPIQTDEPLEHGPPWAMHICVVGSQQASGQGVPLVQHAPPA
jgi:hypothetical protein